MTEAFQLVAGNLALDFANTLDCRYDRQRLVELLPSYADFVRFARQAGILTTHQARRLLREASEGIAERALKDIVEFREASYFLFLSVVQHKTPNPGHLRTFNRFLSGVHTSDILLWQAQGFRRIPRPRSESVTSPLWPVIEAAVGLLTSPDREHICECDEETCRWLFLDKSKNHSRRWCSMQICGNRDKVRRFYTRQRRREAQSASPRS
jgi:predicted RNA-binding Zn ribbon-like protein